MPKSNMFAQTEGWKEVQASMERLLLLGPDLQRRYLGRMARRIIRQSADNIRRQQTVDGQPFVPRKRKKKGNPPLLKSLAKRKFLGVWMGDDEATITYFNQMTGAIANRHQKGLTERLNVKIVNYKKDLDMSTLHKLKPRQTIFGQPGCTVNQAAMLYRLGMTHRGATPGYQEIMTLVPRKSANAIIQALLEKCGRGTRQITVRDPARPFLGANRRQVAEFRDEIMDHIYERICGRGHKI